MHTGPAVVTKSANSGSLSCAAARTTVLGPEESPQLFVHGRRVVRSTHLIVGLLGIKQKWKLGIPFNQHFNFPSVHSMT